MSNPSDVKLLKRGVGLWNKSRNQSSRRNLSGEDFSGWDLRNADFSGTDLSQCDLSAARIAGASFGGANLHGATLPSTLEFGALAHVEEISKHARTIFVGLIGATIYCWLTIAQTTDAALIVDTASTPLPVIQTRVPIWWFYLAAR